MLTEDAHTELVRRALAALQEATGLGGKLVNDKHLGKHIAIASEGQNHVFTPAIRHVDRFAQLVQIKSPADTHNNAPTLLIAPRLTGKLADRCQQLNLAFIDAAGNAYLNRPGLFVLIKGQHGKNDGTLELHDNNKVRAGTPNYLKMVFALLCQPELINAPYRRIQQVVGVALGTIGGMFADLKKRGYLLGEQGNWRLLEQERLIQEWATNFPIKLRPKLNPRKFRAQNPDWWKTTDIVKYGAQWGGEVAAAKLTGHLKPEMATLYLNGKDAQKHLTKLVVDHKLRADPRGNIEVLDAFWHFGDEPMPETVPPLLVYADLMATFDPRNIETANLIHERYLKITTNQR